MEKPKRKRQFKGTSKPRTFFDRKVRQVGYTRYVALGKLIPEGWTYVRLTPLNQTPTTIEVLIERLELTKHGTPTQNPDQTSKPHT